MFDDDRLKTNS